MNAIDSYSEMKCFGKVYHYSKENDVSISGYEIKGKFHPEIIYHFEKGNACLGWSKNEEVAFPYGPINQMQLDKVPNDWQEMGIFVIEDEEAWNQAIYNQFAQRAQRGICSFLRTYILKDGTPIKVIDLQVLDTNQDRILLKVKDADGIHEQRYSRLQFIDENNEKKVEAYSEEATTNEGVELFSFRIE